MNNLTKEIFRSLEDTADGVFIVDSGLQIHMWNNAAEKILGFGKDDVEGQFCYQVLQGTNEEGEPICSKHCRVSKLSRRSESVSSYDTRVRTNHDELCWLNMSILTLRVSKNSDDVMIVHMFRDISQKKNDEILFNQILEKARRYKKNSANIKDDAVPEYQVDKLTRRQQEVLTLLARGFTTREIASSLSISQYTARNHIQLIFQKFHVHSRLEAVAFALKNGLLDYINGEDILKK
jgi:PAS domain S-box-containing protein